MALESYTALNERQKRFCEEYISCKFNGTQAAINAGYSEKSATVESSRLLIKANIQNYLSELIETGLNDLGINISKERTLLEIGRLAFTDIRRFYNENGELKPINELDDDSAACLAGFEIMEEKGGDGNGNQVLLGYTKKIKTYDKTKALEMLAKYHKVYSDAPIQNNAFIPFNDYQVDKIINALRNENT